MCMQQTSRDRPKSAPYLRLKNSKRTWKSHRTQSIKLTKRVSNSRKIQSTELARQVPASAGSWRAKRGDLSHFLTSIVAKHQKIEGTLWWTKIFEKRSHNAEKTEKGESLVTPGTVCYAEKVAKPLWFSSLGQMIPFGTIKFRRTFKNYFGQFVWIGNKPGPAQVSAISKAQK